MLNLPRWGNINLHASLLPKYRGAAPIQWAVANGETLTGATTMRIDQGLDTGDMLLQRSLSIAPNQTAEQLFPICWRRVVRALMRETLEGLEAGTIQPIPQDNAGASLAPILQREDALVDFARSADGDLQPLAWLSALARSLHSLSWPKADSASPPTGGVHLSASWGNNGGSNRLFVAAGSFTRLELLEVQMEGKKRLPVADFLRGTPPQAHERLGS